MWIINKTANQIKNQIRIYLLRTYIFDYMLLLILLLKTNKNLYVRLHVK